MAEGGLKHVNTHCEILVGILPSLGSGSRPMIGMHLLRNRLERAHNQNHFTDRVECHVLI